MSPVSHSYLPSDPAGEEETQEAFREHFEQQLNLYKKMV